jgi:hypothetical protein
VDEARPTKRKRLTSGEPSSREPSLLPDYSVSGESDDSVAPFRVISRIGGILIEIPKNPDFDRSEYISVNLSQSSETQSSQRLSALETEDSRVRLPPLPDDRVIPDSQEWSSLGTPQLQIPGPDLLSQDTEAVVEPHREDCRVIPDSQTQPTTDQLPAVDDLFSSHPVQSSSEDKQEDTEEVAQGFISDGLETHQSGALISDIPSRQPDHLDLSQTQQLIPDEGLYSTSTDDRLPAEGGGENKEPLDFTQSLVFLTQVDLELPSVGTSSGDRVAETPLEQTTKQGKNQKGRSSLSTVIGQTPAGSEETPQEAQIVLGFLSGHNSDFRSDKSSAHPSSHAAPPLREQDSQDDGNGSYQVGSGAVDQSHSEQLPRTSNFTLPAFRHAEEILDSIETGLESENSQLPTSTVQVESRTEQILQYPARMDSEAASITPMSMVDRLRQIQADALRRQSHSSSPLLSPSEERSEKEQETPAELPQQVTIEVPIQTLLPSTEGVAVTNQPDAGDGEGRKLQNGSDHQARTEDGSSDAQELGMASLDDQAATGLGLSIEDRFIAIQPQDLMHGTISPAELSNFVTTAATALETEQLEVNQLIDTGNTAVLSPGIDQQDALNQLVTPVDGPTEEYVVTLPFAANIRPIYISTIIQAAREIENFSELFSREIPTNPEESLILLIDDLFAALLDICDYPTFMDNLPVESMDSEDLKNHAVSTNSKFSFVFEFLEELKDTDKTVLIVVRSKRLLGFLLSVVGSEGYRYSTKGLNDLSLGRYSLRVVLVTSDEEVASPPTEFDVVIGFDHAFRSSAASKKLSEDSSYDKPLPITLSLVVTHSIEHIDMRISRGLELLERKNALLISVVQSQGLIADPERGYPHPHEVAALFASHVKEPNEGFFWEPQPIPDLVFDVYLSTQRTQRHDVGESRLNSRKRGLVSVHRSQ